jgi:hypothetical protein
MNIVMTGNGEFKNYREQENLPFFNNFKIFGAAQEGDGTV